MTVLRPKSLLTIAALILGLVSIYHLETARSGVDMTQVSLGQTPATIYDAGGAADSLVIVSHGFGGSRQMMEAISLTIARAGHTVVSFDYFGHGRHTVPLSPAIDTLTGTTEDLVQQTVDVVTSAKALTGLQTVSFVGHSMATDVIVRAAERVADVDAVIAISMYSDAVTADHPDRLLVISGASEERLRAVALDAVAQIDPATEGETVTQGTMTRRAVSAPWVGHVGVLWSPVTLNEITNWLGQSARPALTGPWIAALLLAILLLFRPIAAVLPSATPAAIPAIGRTITAAMLGAVIAAFAAITGLPAFGIAGFGALGLAFGIWGIVVISIIGQRPTVTGTQIGAAVLLAAWGLGAFALVLDRYGAAFLPTGPRLSLTLILLPATILFGVADRIMVQGRKVWARVLLRLPFLTALMGAMILGPTQLGLVFTVLPVLVLFWLVYGTMSRWAERSGPTGAGIGSGVILAWAVAASTPLFMG